LQSDTRTSNNIENAPLGDKIRRSKWSALLVYVIANEFFESHLDIKFGPTRDEYLYRDTLAYVLTLY
jgi:hypothetical protein